MGFSIPNPIDAARNAVETVGDFGGAVIDRAGDVGEEVIETAGEVGGAFVDGAQTVGNGAVRVAQFQADVTRVGLERAWDGAQAAAGFAGDVVDRATHPGDPNPPAAQGLEFSETKSAADLAYDANVGEVYRFPDGAEWTVADVQDDPNTGFRAVALRPTDPNDQRVIVAYAGTRNGNDWDDNLRQGAGLSSEQYQQAVDFAEKWQATDGDNVILTGHSLGGGLASYASIQTDLRATAVNSAPLALNHTDLNPFDGAPRITQYYVPGEALSVVNEANPLDTRPGENIAVQGRDSILDPRSVGSNHSLDNTAPDIAAPVRVR